MYNQKTIIFDFDGTIANSFEETFNVYNELSKRFKCKPISPKEQQELRNKRPQELLKKYGITKLKLPLLLLKGRKKLQKKMGKIKPAKDMVKALKALKECGFKMGILTSNSKKNVKIFLENNELKNIFDFISTGKHLFGKSKSLQKILKKKKIPKNSVIYIGDETRDVEATKKAGIPIAAVSWGYNTPEILKSLSPTKLVETPKALVEYLKSFFAAKKLL
jgi:HAD superfamily hydrolase (TIGR01549 family)